MILMDEVLAVIIPGNDLSNDKDRNGEMDFLFLSKDKEYKKIKNDDEFERFKNNINTTSKRLAYHSQSFLSSISIFIESSEMLPDFHAVPVKLCENITAVDCSRYRDRLPISDLLVFQPHKAGFHSPSISSADIFHLISHKIILASTYVQNHL